MILCVGISHCLCDGIGSAQFLSSWAQLASRPHADLSVAVSPFHDRDLLKPRLPPKSPFPHPEFTSPESPSDLLPRLLNSAPLVPVSVTFSADQILLLKTLVAPSLKCTSFEVVASHVWRSWIESLNPPPYLKIKLLFSVNVRDRLVPKLPSGFYGNGFVLGCAETTVERLVSSSARQAVRLVQRAKERIDDDYVRSMVDYLEVRKSMPDLSASLVISPWSRIGLEELDFGGGRPVHVGPLASEVYCLFLPVIGDPHGVGVLVSVPRSVVEKFAHCLRNF